jgi:outer membrane protein assembly factor BamB
MEDRVLNLKNLIALGLGSFVFAGCATPNIHRNAEMDPGIMVRQWTLPTHGPFEAGDRGSEQSSPSVYKNTLVFGNQSVGVVALYLETNQVRWVLPIENGVLSPLTLHEDNAYFVGGDGHLYSVKLISGQVNWRVDLRTSIASAPAVREGRLFVTTGTHTLYCFDAGSGENIWYYRRQVGSTATILGASTPLIVGSRVIAGMPDGYLVGLSLNDGRLIWEKRIHRGNKFTDVDAHPVLDGNRIYVPSYDGALYAVMKTGNRILWRFDAGGSKKVTTEGGRIYFPSSNGTIYALKKENAKVDWKFELDSGTPTGLAVTKDYIVVGSSYRYLYVLSKRNGELLYRYNVGPGSGFSGSPSYDPETEMVFFLSGAGNLYSFKLFPEAKDAQETATLRQKKRKAYRFKKI